METEEEKEDELYRQSDQEIRGGSDAPSSDGAGAYTAILAQLAAQQRATANIHAIAQQSSSIVWCSTGHFPMQGVCATASGPIDSAISMDRPPIKDDGVQVGEIVAWRVWRVEEGWLHSTAMTDFEWTPGKTMEAAGGLVDEHAGIHAFKNRKDALDYARVHSPAVVGEVELWGSIIEFQSGWHAQFARPKEFHLYVDGDAHGDRSGWLKRKTKFAPFLEDLRATYGIGKDVMEIPRMRSQIPETKHGA